MATNTTSLSYAATDTNIVPGPMIPMLPWCGCGCGGSVLVIAEKTSKPQSEPPALQVVLADAAGSGPAKDAERLRKNERQDANKVLGDTLETLSGRITMDTNEPLTNIHYIGRAQMAALAPQRPPGQ